FGYFHNEVSGHPARFLKSSGFFILILSFLILHPGQFFAASTPGAGTMLCPPVSVNSVTAPALGFHVLTKGDITLRNGDIEGPVASWGNLNLNGTISVATGNPGTFVVSGDGRPTALIVEGVVNYNSGNGINLLNNSYIKLKDLTGSVVYTSFGGSPVPTRVTPNAYGDSPRISSSTFQQTSSVGPVDVFNFTGTFNTFQTDAGMLGGYANT